METFNPTKMIQTQLEKAFAQDLGQSDPTPGGATEPRTSIPEPPQVAASTTAEAPKSIPDDRMDKLLAAFEIQQKELAALKKSLPKPPAPEPRSTVKSVEQQVADLRQQLEDSQELHNIEKDLPSVPEYGTIKSIPDLARTVLNTIREEKRAARERGEGDTDVSVKQIAAQLKKSYIENLRQHLQNQELLKEIGFSAQATAPTANSSRALTSDLTTSGSTRAVQKHTSIEAMIKSQVDKALKMQKL